MTSFSRCLRTGLIYSAGVLLAVGPWLLRNFSDTGNPVYPLLYDVFGGADWSAELNAKWKAGHSPDSHQLTQIPRYLADVAIRSDWTSGLLVALSVPALLLWRRIFVIRWLALMAVWMLVTWWGLTHRIDRFWVPVIPVLAMLAGASWQVFRNRGGRIALIAVVVVCSVFHLGFWKIPTLTGFQAGLLDLERVSLLTIRRDFQLLNQILPVDAKVLMVGEAEVFDANFDVVYNTVFDQNIFEQWTAVPNTSAGPAGPPAMASPEEVQTRLRQQGITHLVVNWSEILRYRRPGSYGYTDYIQPAKFIELVQAGVLEPPIALMPGDFNRLSDSDRRLVLSWDGGGELVSGQIWQSVQSYRVATDPARRRP